MAARERSETDGGGVDDDASPADAPPNGAAFLRRYLSLPANRAFFELRLKAFASRAAEFTGLGVEEAARELMTEVYAEVWTKSLAFDPTRPPLLFLLGVAANICKRWREKAGGRRSRFVSLNEPALQDTLAVASGGPEANLLNSDFAARLMQELPPEDARLFRLRAVEDRSFADIGARLHLTEINARVRYGRIRRKLQERCDALMTEETHLLTSDARTNKGGRR